MTLNSHPTVQPPSSLADGQCHSPPAPGPRYLCLGEHQRRGHLKALGSGQVLVELELVLQLQELLAGEGCAGPAALPHQARLRDGCRTDSGRGSKDSGAGGCHRQPLGKPGIRRKASVSSIISCPNNGFIAWLIGTSEICYQASPLSWDQSCD